MSSRVPLKTLIRVDGVNCHIYRAKRTHGITTLEVVFRLGSPDWPNWEYIPPTGHYARLSSGVKLAVQRSEVEMAPYRPEFAENDEENSILEDHQDSEKTYSVEQGYRNEYLVDRPTVHPPVDLDRLVKKNRRQTHSISGPMNSEDVWKLYCYLVEELGWDVRESFLHIHPDRRIIIIDRIEKVKGRKISPFCWFDIQMRIWRERDPKVAKLLHRLAKRVIVDEKLLMHYGVY